MQLDQKADCQPWPLAGYAPGNYTCKCIDCEERFSGDKRAIRCLKCAAVVANQRLQAVQPVPVGWQHRFRKGWNMDGEWGPWRYGRAKMHSIQSFYEERPLYAALVSGADNASAPQTEEACDSNK